MLNREQDWLCERPPYLHSINSLRKFWLLSPSPDIKVQIKEEEYCQKQKKKFLVNLLRYFEDLNFHYTWQIPRDTGKLPSYYYR